MAAKTIRVSVKACHHHAQILPLDDRSYLLSCGLGGADCRVVWLGTAVQGFALSTEQGAAVKPVAAREVSERSRKTAGCARRSGGIVCFTDRGAGHSAVSGGYGPRLDPCRAVCVGRAASDGTGVHAFSAFVVASPSFGLISSASMARSGHRGCKGLSVHAGTCWRQWASGDACGGQRCTSRLATRVRTHRSRLPDKTNATRFLWLFYVLWRQGFRCSTFSIKTIAMDARSNR